jgi:hypothetical protein
MAALSEILDLRSIVAITVVFAIVYPLYLAVVRLYFSPLAGFPGPKIAAASFWYEFYYDFWKSGKYIFEIKKMHEKYGKSSVPAYRQQCIDKHRPHRASKSRGTVH